MLGLIPPRIKYCSAPAGRVAYSASGAGPALLFDSGGITDLRGQPELYSFGSFIERLAQRFTVIRYDKPGCGLSDRAGIDLSFDGQVAAALAVADAVGAGGFRMFGASQGGQLAAAIAARYPGRVEALVLYGMCASGRDLAPAEVRDSVVALVHVSRAWLPLSVTDRQDSLRKSRSVRVIGRVGAVHDGHRSGRSGLLFRLPPTSWLSRRAPSAAPESPGRTSREIRTWSRPASRFRVAASMS